MKKALALTLALVMALALVACGGSEAPASSAAAPESAPAVSQPAAPESVPAQPDPVETAPAESAPSQPAEVPAGWLTTRTGRFYSQFSGQMYMEYETTYEGVTMTMVTATDGDRSYTESRMDGTSMGATIMEGETMYAIDHSSKMVVKMSMGATGQEVAATLIEEEDIDPADLITGTREVDGKTYDTEEWVLDGAKSILCFDGDELAYLIGEAEGTEMVLKILAFSDKPDASLFEIPADYQVIAY